METLIENRNETLSLEELRSLAAETDKHCVSIYMPLRESGTDIRQDVIRLGNALRQAQEMLSESGLSASTAEKLVKPARTKVEDLFWEHPNAGLALLVSQDTFRYYWAPLQLDQSVTVSHHFYIRPLLPLFAGQGSFYILVLTLNEVRLLKSTRYETSEVALPREVPKSLTDALKYDDFEPQRQFYTGTTGGGKGRSGRAGAIFYGQGTGNEVEKENVMRYFQAIDKGLHSLLRNERTPMVLCGVGYLLSMFKQISSYRYLSDEVIEGNPNGRSGDDLRRRAWTILQHTFEEPQRQAIDKYNQFIGTGHASNRLEEVVPAAYSGQVATLLLPELPQQWGIFDPASGSVTVHAAYEPGDEDLLDLALRYTLLNGGMAYSARAGSLPEGTPIAALFHY